MCDRDTRTEAELRQRQEKSKRKGMHKWSFLTVFSRKVIQFVWKIH